MTVFIAAGWGGGLGDTACYTNKNVMGDQFGNCGHNPATNTYITCATEDVMCGQLQCRGGYFSDNNYEGFDVSVTVNEFETTYSTYYGYNVKCLSFTVAPSEPTQSPGLVETGTKCEEGKV